MDLKKAVQFFFEKHPYISANAVEFKTEDNAVVAHIKKLGVTRAYIDEDHLVGFDVLELSNGEKVLLNKANYENLSHHALDFAKPSKAPNINPHLVIPVPGGVRMRFFKLADYVADVEREGNYYNVTVYDEEDKIVENRTMLTQDELVALLAKYGLKADEETLEVGGVVANAEPLIVASKPQAEVKVASNETMKMYRLENGFYSTPFGFEKDGARTISGEKMNVVFYKGAHLVTDRGFLIPENAEELVVPKPVLAETLHVEDICILTDGIYATEPFQVKEAAEGVIKGVGRDDEPVEIYKVATNTLANIRTKEKTIYIVPKDWKVYKLAESKATTVKEKVGEIFIARLGSRYYFSFNDKASFGPIEKLRRWLARHGVGKIGIAFLEHELSKKPTVKVFVYRTTTSRSDSEDTTTISDKTELKVKKASSLYGNVSGDDVFKLFEKTQRTLLDLLEQSQQGEIPLDPEMILRTAQGLDEIIRNYVTVLYKKQEENS